jgi:general secretion pathway protein A
MGVKKMYCDYWQLDQPPFENVANPQVVFYSPNHDEALMRLLYTVKGQKGASMLTGEVGCGKTTISKVFQERLQKANFEVALITNPNLSSVELLQEILYQLRVSTDYTTKVQLIHALNDRVLESLRDGKETIVIIDEAHLIQEKQTYEELRLLLNFQQNNRFLLTLILVGQPELKQLIRKLPQFEQRIPIKYHLNPLNATETIKYVQFRLKKAGAKKNVFTKDAAKKIYEHSGGIPRRINNICDMSLLVGFAKQAPIIDSAIIKKIIEEEA